MAPAHLGMSAPGGGSIDARSGAASELSEQRAIRRASKGQPWKSCLCGGICVQHQLNVEDACVSLSLPRGGKTQVDKREQSAKWLTKVGGGVWSPSSALDFVNNNSGGFIALFHFDKSAFVFGNDEEGLPSRPKWNGNILDIEPITDGLVIAGRIQSYKRAQATYRQEHNIPPHERLPIHVQSALVQDALRHDATAPARPGPLQRREIAAATRLSLGAGAEPVVGTKRQEPLAPRTPPNHGKAPAYSPGLRSAMRRGAQAMLREPDLQAKMQELGASWQQRLRESEAELRATIARLESESATLRAQLEGVSGARSNELGEAVGTQRLSFRRLQKDPKLRRVCADITSFDTPETFQAWFDVVCDKKGTEYEGAASKLPYWSGRDDVPMEFRKSIAEVYGGDDPVNHSTNRRLASHRPAGLQPIDACLLTLYIMRSGIKTRLAAAQFGVSEGAASQIFTTWVCYLHQELQREHPWPTREEIARTRPVAFVRMGARDARLTIDATEFVVEIGDEPVLKKLLW